jgi:hypothetical protein
MSDIKKRRIRRVRTTTLVGVLLVLLLIGSTTQAEPAEDLTLSRSVIGGGGGQSVGDEHSLGGTVGQSVLGAREAGSHSLCAGFWCGLGRYGTYLPLVLRDA